MSGSRWRGGYSSYSGTRIVLSELSSAARAMVGELEGGKVADDEKDRIRREVRRASRQSWVFLALANHMGRCKNADYRQDGACPTGGPRMVRRLRIDGPRILYPNGEVARLRGFNLMYMLNSEFRLPREDTDDRMLQELPLTNLVRLVIIHWDDRPTLAGGKDSSNDCSVTTGSEAISQRCLKQIDAVLRWTASQNLWVVLVARASLAAGEEAPGIASSTVFGNAALRKRFLSMWAVVAERYKGFDMIAGYEIMSEPRVTDKEVSHARVRDFYAAGCNVIWEHDNAPWARAVLRPRQHRAESAARHGQSGGLQRQLLRAERLC